MNVTIISDTVISEFGDFTLSLAKNLSDKNNVDIILPYYENEYDKTKYDFKNLGSYEVRQGSRCITVEILYYETDSVRCYFISNSYLYSRTKRHGYADEAERSAVFCKSALELFRHRTFYPDYIFSIGCFCALVPIYLKLNYSSDEYYRSVKSFHYINDKRYGIFDKLLAKNVFGIYESNIHIITASNEINLTKGAIICANRVFVGEAAASILKDINSPCHSAVIQFGFKIRKLFVGVDYDIFNSENNLEIFSSFSSENILLKEENKTAILLHYGFEPKDDTPLIIMFTDKVNSISGKQIEDILRCNLYMVAVGSNLEGLKINSGDSHFAIENSVDLYTVTQLFSGADFAIFNSDSYFENGIQYISLAYGCIPIVPFRSYFESEIKYFNKITKEGNGFTFDKLNQSDLLYTLWDAVGIYRHDPKCFYRLRANCMKKQFPLSITAKQIESEAEKCINVSF